MLTIGRSVRDIRALRFIAAGAVNTIFGYIIYIFGLLLQLQPTVALAVSFFIGALFNYFTTARFVFSHNKLNKLPLFAGVYVLVYIVNVACIKILLRYMMPPSLAQMGLVPFMAALSYFLFKTFVFDRTATIDSRR